MRTRRSVYVRFLAAFAVLGVLGLGASVYVLVQQRVRLPFEQSRTLRIAFDRADGVIAGVGQPVNVAGVKVGQITGVELEGGLAVVSARLDPEQVPRVHADARARLEPITPLKDMQIDLDPGRPPAVVLDDGATLPVARTRTPVELADLLSSLDADTRTYLSGLIASVSTGTRERGPDLRRMLLALGPATESADRISRALERRRAELARLVTNLGAVTAAATRDERLAEVVAAGNATLGALADQDVALRAALGQLPATLGEARRALDAVEPLGAALEPALTDLTPTARALPETVHELRPFLTATNRALARDVRPLLREAAPLLRDARPAVRDLDRATEPLTGATLALTYFFNLLGHNPPGDDEGFLFWTAWAFHNLNSLASTGDAHGAIARATRIVDCAGVQQEPAIQASLGVLGLCPE